jgi:hypothetical protein
VTSPLVGNICPVCGLSHRLIERGGWYPEEAINRALQYHTIYEGGLRHERNGNGGRREQQDPAAAAH